MSRFRSILQHALIVLIAVSLGVGFAWARWYQTRDPICYDHFGEIETGMSRGQVIDLLGCPPGEYGGPTNYTTRICEWCKAEDWRGTRGTITVYFTFDDTVISTSLCRETGKQ